MRPPSDCSVDLRNVGGRYPERCRCAASVIHRWLRWSFRSSPPFTWAYVNSAVPEHTNSLLSSVMSKYLSSSCYLPPLSNGTQQHHRSAFRGGAARTEPGSFSPVRE